MVLLLCSCVLTSFWLGLHTEHWRGLRHVCLAMQCHSCRVRVAAEITVLYFQSCWGTTTTSHLCVCSTSHPPVTNVVHLLLSPSVNGSSLFTEKLSSILARMSQGLGIILIVWGWKILSLWNPSFLCTYIIVWRNNITVTLLSNLHISSAAWCWDLTAGISSCKGWSRCNTNRHCTEFRSELQSILGILIIWSLSELQYGWFPPCFYWLL